MTPLTLTVTPSSAADAYRSTDDLAAGAGGDASSFGSVLQRAIDGAIQTGHEADTQSMKAIAGGGNITEVVTAVSKAELVLQSTAAIRDRFVQSYQDVMHMAI